MNRATVLQDGVGDNTHQPHVPSAVHQANLAFGEDVP
jgi:hypothetical protein